MKALVISFILLGAATTAAADTGEICIDPEILTRVVKIEAFSETSQKKVSGSGFVVSQKLVSPLIRVFFLITNKGMVSDWLPPDFKLNKYNKYLDVYFYGVDSTVLAIPKRIPLFDADGNFRDDIVHVHADASADIAVIYLHEDLYSSDGIALDSFDSSDLMPFDSVIDSDITMGSRVCALGFPQGTPATTRNHPAATFGFLSPVPGGSVTIDFAREDRKNENTGVFNTGEKLFIIDGITVPGNSGGPVILPSMAATRIAPDTKMFQNQAEANDNMVLGILSGGSLETGLSYAFSSDYIMEALFQFLDNRGVTQLPHWPEARQEIE